MGWRVTSPRGGQPLCRLAAAFIGLFGYIDRTVLAKGIGSIAEHYGVAYGRDAAWNVVFASIIAGVVAATNPLLIVWRVRSID